MTTVNKKEAKKLLKELVKKFPDRVCSVDMIFSTRVEEHFVVYVSDSHHSSIKNYFSADAVRKEYGL